MLVRQNPYRTLLIAVAALGLATVGYAQSPENQGQSGTMMGQHSQMMGNQGNTQEQEENMPPWWKQQREWYHKMWQQRQQADQRLDQLMEKMNAATGNAKVDAMQAVINELVKQREEWQHWRGMMGRNMGYGMGYGMGPGMMGYGMGYGMGPGMMGYGMGSGQCCPCRHHAPGEGGGSSSETGK